MRLPDRVRSVACSTLLFLLSGSCKVAAQHYQTFSALNSLGSHFGVPFFNGTFDYVVVGGGTAGLTLAARLAENAATTVAVIEAGGLPDIDNGNLTSVPGYASYWVGADPALNNPLIDWAIRTQPMRGLNNRQFLYSQGKTLGGGSSRNSLAYHRPTVQSMQLWADKVKDKSYTFQAMRPYFEKSIQLQPANERLRARNATVRVDQMATYGSSGPLKVSWPNTANAFSSWIALALKELGFKECGGFLSGTLNGYHYSSQTLERDSQTRSSSVTSFLEDSIQKRNNLIIYKGTLAQRILLNSEKRATGVLVSQAGANFAINARKEVIVSAGVFRSPQLLMLSGIGPRDQLEPLNIPVVSALAGVGQNMADQVDFAVTHEVNLVTHSKLQDPAFMQSQISMYVANRVGQLTNTAADLIGWEKLPQDLRAKLQPNTLQSLNKDFPKDWPEIELIFSDGYGGNLEDFLLGAPLDGKNYGSIGVGLVALFSRGTVKINSTDAAVNPLVNPNLLGDPRDQDFAIQAFKRIRQIAKAKVLQSVFIGKEAYPGEKVSTDAQILENIKRSINTIYHASGTNTMGPLSDPMAVVDSKARVHGVKSLRVVDASVFPILPPGHPQSTVYALAEKIADDIKKGQ